MPSDVAATHGQTHLGVKAPSRSHDEIAACLHVSARSFSVRAITESIEVSIGTRDHPRAHIVVPLAIGHRNWVVLMCHIKLRRVNLRMSARTSNKRMSS